MQRCKRCHKVILYSTRNLYCPSCSKKIKFEHNQKFLKNKYDKKLGTTTFKAHRIKDFNKELIAIEKEKKRLGLK